MMKKWIITLLLLLGWSFTMAQSDSTQLVKVEAGDEVDVWVPDATTMQEKSAPKKEKTRKESHKRYTFDELVKKYGSREGYRTVIFERKMMQMMAERVKDQDRELANLLKGIYAIKALSSSQYDPEFEADIKSWPESLDYVSLISQVEENGQWTSYYIIDGGRWELSAFMMVSHGKGQKEQTALLIKGYFSVKDISRLSSIQPK